jgi:hypothetical protein
MESQGESTAMAASSTHAVEPAPKPTLLADQPLPHIFSTLLDLQDDVSHLLQIILEQGSKIQEQGIQIKELSALCELLRETQLDNRVSLRAIHDHILPQSKGKEPAGQGRVSFRQTHWHIKPKKDSFRKDDESGTKSTDEDIRISEFFPRSKYSESTPRKRIPAPAAPASAPAPAAPASTSAPAAPASTPTATIAIPKLSSPDGYDGKKKGRPARQWMARVLAWMELSRAAFPNERAVLLYLLHLLKDDAANWAEPHLRKVLEMKQGALATIPEFVDHFYNAFDDPDAERAAERRIQELNQETVCQSPMRRKQDKVPKAMSRPL